MIASFTAMSLLQVVLFIVIALFVLYLVGYAAFQFFAVIAGSSQLHQRKQRGMRHKSQILSDAYLPISIIVPTYNDETRVVRAIESLLKLDYSLYEIIVVDDGSTDRTIQNLIEAFQLREIKQPIRRQLLCGCEEAVYLSRSHKAPITLVKKVHGGRSDALNMGINTSKYPYFTCVDVSTTLERDTLTCLSAPLIENENVVVVEGLAKPSQGEQASMRRVAKRALPNGLVPALYALEHARTNFAKRILLDRFNGNVISPDQLCLFRKDTVIICGGYQRNTADANSDLIAHVHAFCRANDQSYTVRYTPDAVCWTRGPETMSELINSYTCEYLREREIVDTYGSDLLNAYCGVASFACSTYFVLYGLWAPFIELGGILAIIIALACGFMNPLLAIALFVTCALFDALMSFMAFFTANHAKRMHISPGDALRGLGLSLFEATGMHISTLATRMRTMHQRWKAQHMTADAAFEDSESAEARL